LLHDALQTDRLIAMATLRPGWEKDYEGRPPVYPMACLGQIVAHHRQSDGTFNVLLLGLQRIRMVQELKPTRLFREAQVELCDDRYRPCSMMYRRDLQQRLRNAIFQILPIFPEVQEQLDQLLSKDVPLGVLTDIIGCMLDIDLARKQALLAEVDVYRRTKLLLDSLSVTALELVARDSALCFPPAFSLN
jgi:Lon protease-like protein